MNRSSEYSKVINGKWVLNYKINLDSYLTRSLAG